MSTQVKTPSYSKELQELRNNLETVLPEESLNVFDTDAATLQRAHQTILRIQPGDKAPGFTLGNAIGTPVTLSELLSRSKVVIAFYRGSWCPYCNLQLGLYQKGLEDINSLGATLVAISPQTPDESLTLKEKNALGFEVLSDPGNTVAKKYTSVFKNGTAPLAAMEALGIDFDTYYSDDSKEIPVPAVFIIDRDGTVLFAKSEGGDYRNRVELTEILEALRK